MPLDVLLQYAAKFGPWVFLVVAILWIHFHERKGWREDLLNLFSQHKTSTEKLHQTHQDERREWRSAQEKQAEKVSDALNKILLDVNRRSPPRR